MKFSRNLEEERLQKVMARAGVASRREAENMITEGRVTVNGVQVVELGSRVKPRKDIILVDGKKIALPDTKELFWVMVHKPKDMLSSGKINTKYIYKRKVIYLISQ